jgi:hypothetical protein
MLHCEQVHGRAAPWSAQAAPDDQSWALPGLPSSLHALVSAAAACLGLRRLLSSLLAGLCGDLHRPGARGGGLLGAAVSGRLVGAGAVGLGVDNGREVVAVVAGLQGGGRAQEGSVRLGRRGKVWGAVAARPGCMTAQRWTVMQGSGRQPAQAGASTLTVRVKEKETWSS